MLISAASSGDRQGVYDAQNVTPVELSTDATLDLNASGIAWVIRDLLNANLLRVLEGSSGSTSEIQFAAAVDVFNNDAALNDFLAGLKVRSGGARPIDLGVTDGVVETTAGDLMVKGFAELLLDDANQTTSSWAQDGIKLSDTTAEWDAFETAFGEVSLLDAIRQASTTGGGGFSPVKAVAQVTAVGNTAADTDISLSDGILDTALGNLSGGTFIADHDIYLNGDLMVSGANLAAAKDVYPGTDLNNGGDAQLRFSFKLKKDDVITVRSFA
jgi:hypothetical protein